MFKCRNPLSLDMGWKGMMYCGWRNCLSSQSAFAGYGLKSDHYLHTHGLDIVAIRFRWIWVEKYILGKRADYRYESQSAFAGYGLKRHNSKENWPNIWPSQSAFAGYGLKSCLHGRRHSLFFVAIRFRWIWVEKLNLIFLIYQKNMSQSAFAGYGLKREYLFCCTFFFIVAIRFRWIWVEKKEEDLFKQITKSRNPLSLDMGWKGSLFRALC